MRSSKSAVGGAALKLRKSGLVHWLLEALWPRRCPACRLPTPSRGVDWCESCATALARSPGQPYCPRCGADASPLVVRAGGCPNCRGQSIRYSQLVRVGGYDGPLREAIIRFKYQGQAKLDRTLAKLLLAGLYGTDWFEQVELTGRGVVNTLRVARTVADLDRSPFIEAVHALEALTYKRRAA